MTHTSTEQELKDIEQALRLAREAHQHEVDAYRPELYKPECDRRPKYQLDRLGDLICLLQNILYAAQQAFRRVQVVPDEVIESARQLHRAVRAKTFDMQHDDAFKPAWEKNTKAALRVLQYLIDAASPQSPESNSPEFDGIKTEAAPVQLPEPVAVAFRFETEESGPTETSFYPSDRIGMGWTALYTEQQVRDLLAAHGIQEQST